MVKKLLKFNTYLVLGGQCAPNGDSEGKILIIDTVTQSRLNIIKKNIVKIDELLKTIGYGVLEVTLRVLFLETKF